MGCSLALVIPRVPSNNNARTMTSLEIRGQSRKYNQMALVRKPEMLRYLRPSTKGSCVCWCDRETLSSNGYDRYVSSAGGRGKPRTTIIKNTNHPQSHTSGDLEEEARLFDPGFLED